MEQIIRIAFPFAFNILKYFLLAGIPFLIFYKLYQNHFSKNKIQEKSAKRKDFIREVLHSMQATIVIVLVSFIFFLTPLRGYTQIYENLADFPTWWIPVSLFLSLVIHDTYFYWMHRTLHHPKLYKKTHLVHHQSTNPSPWASFSFHALESVAEALVIPLILFTLPMHKFTLLLFGIVSTMINVYGHLGFEIMPKWFRKTWLFEILNTSVHHNLHHEKFTGNYGLYFRVWDRLMGTEHPDYVKEFDKIQKRRFGKNLKGLISA
jgi:lathosterol oxidase